MLIIRPEHCVAAYDFLQQFTPFSRWGLPHSEEVEFQVKQRDDVRGEYWLDNGRHVILVSSACVGFPITLLEVMAHEMIHLKQQKDGENTRSQHNAGFRRLAKQVCRVHGFDLKAFS